MPTRRRHADRMRPAARPKLAERSGVLDNAGRGRKTRWRPAQYDLRTTDPLRPAADPRPPVPVQDPGAGGCVPVAFGVALVACRTSHRGRAHCGGARARAFVHPGLLASTHAVLRQTPAARAPRRLEIGLLDLAVGGR